MELALIQQSLAESRLDGWLFYDFRHCNAIAYRALNLPDGLIVTRRWYLLRAAYRRLRWPS